MQSARGARGTTGAGGSTYATPSASPASQDQQAGLHHYDSRRIQQTRIEHADKIDRLTSVQKIAMDLPLGDSGPATIRIAIDIKIE